VIEGNKNLIFGVVPYTHALCCLVPVVAVIALAIGHAINRLNHAIFSPGIIDRVRLADQRRK
jgi:hypothetical protein